MSGTDILQKKVVFFGGRGGAGKTVCAAATGLQAAGEGKNTLVFSSDPAHSLTDTFDQPVGNEITSIGEVEILNGENTDLNIILGLCVGHDTLFTEHSEAPVTTLVVKDPGHALPPRPEN